MRSDGAAQPCATGVDTKGSDLEQTGSGIRNRLSDAANELERARHAAQRVLFSMLVTEGLTMADVGRTFGVSRSLVSRMLHEEG